MCLHLGEAMSAYRNDTSLGGSDRRFPLTQWTKISDPAQQAAVMADLCDKYWRPLYCYVRGRGFSNEHAKDLVQGFFTEKVLGQEFVQKADKGKGRFRNFLLVALRNYIINTQKKKRPSVVEDYPDEGIAATESAGAQFDRAWAEDVLESTLGRLRTECQKRGKLSHWDLFKEWVLEPKIEGEGAEMEEVCRKYGFNDVALAYKAVFRMKERFRAILRDDLRTLAGGEGEVDTEIDRFIEVFSRK